MSDCTKNKKKKDMIENREEASQANLNAEELMDSSDERYRIAAENSSEIILDYDVQNHSIYHATDKVTMLYGVPQMIDHVPESLVERGVVQKDSAKEFVETFRRIDAGERQVEGTIQTKTANGELRWNQVILTTVFDDNGVPVRAVGVLKDITPLHNAELQCEKIIQHRDAVMKDALLYYEADLTTQKMVYGLKSILLAKGLDYTDDYQDAVEILVSNLVYEEDQPMVRDTFRAENLLREYDHGVSKVEAEYRRRGEMGELLWVRGTAYLAEDKQSDSVKIYYYVNDINELKLKQLKLQEQAEQDLLTGLYNKMTTEMLIQKAIESNNEKDGIDAFLIIDLDDFKNVNDQLGHAYGDAVLSEMAQRLKTMCRGEDIAGRIGGDEFVLYLKSLPSLEVAERRAAEICEIFRTGHAANLSVSKVSGTVGVALFPNHGESFQELYENADRALYEAKARGKDTWCVYSSEISKNPRKEKVITEADRNEGKVFGENIMEYVFRILYESKNLHQAVCGVVELIAKHYHFSRGYIYEKTMRGDFACTFEWCASETSPLSDEFKTLNKACIEKYRQNFEPEGTYLVTSEDELSEKEKGAAAFVGLQGRYQCALTTSGEFQGFLGFDTHAPGMIVTTAMQNAIRGVAQVVDVFLAETQANMVADEMDTVLQSVMNSLHTCTYIIDPKIYELKYINQSAQQVIPEAKIGTICYESIRGRSAPCDDCPIERLERENLQYINTEMYMDKYQLWAKIDASLITVSGNKKFGLFNGYEFTEYKKQNGSYLIDVDAFTRDTSLYDALTLSTDDYIFMCDMPKNLFYFPKAMVDEFALPGQIIEDAIPIWGSLIHESERAVFFRSIENMLSGKVNYHNEEYRALNKDGNWVWLRCRGTIKYDENGNPSLFAGVITNLGKKTKIDYITGLPDKYEFEVQTRACIAEKQPQWGALLLMGLDNFKYINTLYGWEYGDEVLRDIAQQLQVLLPAGVQLYRLDSDKFGVFFIEPKPNAVESYFKNIFDITQNQVSNGERRYRCTISGGCTLFHEKAVSFNMLFKQAEYALEYSKTEGKNRMSLYDEESMSGRSRTLSLIELLQESVNQDFKGFEIYYQPQIQPATRSIKNAEALLRWRCNEFGMVPPDQFIPLLEQTGLIHKVGLWVLQGAAKTCKEWRNICPDFVINVNLSYAQFQNKEFLPILNDMVRHETIDPDGIHLELTESCIAAGSSSLTSAFETLRGLGFAIEMDDFGTGYSSLEILKNAPADVVKIDRAFVRDITRSDFDATFIQFVVSLCHSVGIQVCLEGVESWAEYYLVEPMGLDLIQGFLFGRPQTAKEFEIQFLKNVNWK